MTDLQQLADCAEPRITDRAAARIARLLPGGDFASLDAAAQIAFVETIRSKRLRPVVAVKLKTPAATKAPKIAKKPPQLDADGKPVKTRKPRMKKIKLSDLQDAAA